MGWYVGVGGVRAYDEAAVTLENRKIKVHIHTQIQLKHVHTCVYSLLLFGPSFVLCMLYVSQPGLLVHVYVCVRVCV